MSSRAGETTLRLAGGVIGFATLPVGLKAGVKVVEFGSGFDVKGVGGGVVARGPGEVCEELAVVVVVVVVSLLRGRRGRVWGRGSVIVAMVSDISSEVVGVWFAREGGGW